jgi:hypothetical protein
MTERRIGERLSAIEVAQKALEENAAMRSVSPISSCASKRLSGVWRRWRRWPRTAGARSSGLETDQRGGAAARLFAIRAQKTKNNQKSNGPSSKIDESR